MASRTLFTIASNSSRVITPGWGAASVSAVAGRTPSGAWKTEWCISRRSSSPVFFFPLLKRAAISSAQRSSRALIALRSTPELVRTRRRRPGREEEVALGEVMPECGRGWEIGAKRGAEAGCNEA